MTIPPVIAFFNNKGGVGKTSLVYHLAWMYRDLGLGVVAVDLDPQANLTAAFLEEGEIEALWPESEIDRPTVYGAIVPLIKGTGDVSSPVVREIDSRLHLLAGDLSLGKFEDDLSQQWPGCLDRQERAFRVTSAFWRVIASAAVSKSAAVVLVDLGPNLGAINRSALIASDYLVVPVAPDLFSLQGLRNLGPAIESWRAGWKDRLARNPDPSLELPAGKMQPMGYVVLQHAERLSRPVKAYARWVQRIPRVYAESVAHEPAAAGLSFSNDPRCLSLLRHYRSLMPMGQEARKPIFHLRPADGAIGSHFAAVTAARHDFEKLARTIGTRVGLSLP